MSVNPAIRLIFILIATLILFFISVTYTNILASKNVELGTIDSLVNSELSARGSHQEKVIQELNEELRSMQRSENIQRISPESTVKIRDIEPVETDEIEQNQQKNSQPVIVVR